MKNQKIINSFIAYLKQEMIFHNSTSGKLKGLLDQRMNNLITEEDKIDLLLQVGKLKYAKNIDVYYLGGIQDFFDYVTFLTEDLRIVSEGSQLVNDLKQLLSIPTKANAEQILRFWLKLQGENERGEPYWENEQEIKHFVNQNFYGFPGVNEIKEFNPNMNKSELNHVTWTFFNLYGIYKSKIQYADLLNKNFTKFRNDKSTYKNMKDQCNEHLKILFK